MGPSVFILALSVCVAAAGAVVGAGIGTALAQPAEEAPAYGPELEGFDYPWPVSNDALTSQGEKLHMAYMDMKPSGPPNGKTAVLFHGKNFCAATWQGTIAELTAAGYRVIAVDQIGFCKSSKPAHYQFSFQQLAGNTHALLASLGLTRVIIIGHSMGGMLGMRYALMFPDDVEQLVLVNPIGLEDGKPRACPGRASTPGINKS
jgi:pimeloyl-ACP methyl ester carboxylesterase